MHDVSIFKSLRCEAFLSMDKMLEIKAMESQTFINIDMRLAGFPDIFGFR